MRPPSTTIGELFRDGPIEITVTQVAGNRVRLGIQADRRLLVLRTELRRRPKTAKPGADESSDDSDRRDVSADICG